MEGSELRDNANGPSGHLPVLIERVPGDPQRWQWYCPICMWGETAYSSEDAEVMGRRCHSQQA